jgi:transposase
MPSKIQGERGDIATDLHSVFGEIEMTSDSTHVLIRYPSDLSDEEWAVIEPILNELYPYTTGRHRKSDLREILNAIFYLNKTGCPWRYLPKDFPPYTLVNYYYNKWTHSGLLEQLNAALRARLRKRQGRDPDPSGAVIDSQSVKGTPESSVESGFDGGLSSGCLCARREHLRRQGGPLGPQSIICAPAERQDYLG